MSKAFARLARLEPRLRDLDREIRRAEPGDWHAWSVVARKAYRLVGPCREVPGEPKLDPLARPAGDTLRDMVEEGLRAFAVREALLDGTDPAYLAVHRELASGAAEYDVILYLEEVWGSAHGVTAA